MFLVVPHYHVNFVIVYVNELKICNYLKYTYICYVGVYIVEFEDKQSYTNGKRITRILAVKKLIH